MNRVLVATICTLMLLGPLAPILSIGTPVESITPDGGWADADPGFADFSFEFCHRGALLRYAFD